MGGLALFPVASSIPYNAAANEETIHPKKKSSSSRRQKKGDVPNILFIIDDQHRSDFLGAAGADWIKTLNLDKLAKEGARFSNAYCALPLYSELVNELTERGPKWVVDGKLQIQKTSDLTGAKFPKGSSSY